MTNAEENVCRICLVSERRGKLIAPCLCKGTQRFVHRECLNEWRSQSHAFNAFSHCPTCKFEYLTEETHVAMSHKIINGFVLLFDVCGCFLAVPLAICFLAKFIHVCDPNGYVAKHFPQDWVQLNDMPLSFGPYYWIATLLMLIAVGGTGLAICCTQEVGIEVMTFLSQGLYLIYCDLVFLLLCSMLLLIATSLLVSKNVHVQNLLARLFPRSKVCHIPRPTFPSIRCAVTGFPVLLQTLPVTLGPSKLLRRAGSASRGRPRPLNLGRVMTGRPDACKVDSQPGQAAKQPRRHSRWGSPGVRRRRGGSARCGTQRTDAPRVPAALVYCVLCTWPRPHSRAQGAPRGVPSQGARALKDARRPIPRSLAAACRLSCSAQRCGVVLRMESSPHTQARRRASPGRSRRSGLSTSAARRTLHVLVCVCVCVLSCVRVSARACLPPSLLQNCNWGM
jgi:hypothetical protein